MPKLAIIEFGVQTHANYQSPVLFSANQSGEILSALCNSDLGVALDLDRVRLDKNDGLFGYRLSVPMLSGTSEIAVNARVVVVTFGKGFTKANVRQIRDLTALALKASVRHPVRLWTVTFSGHAQFESSELYTEYMRPFEQPEFEVEAGGFIWSSKMTAWDGELRLVVEKSLLYPNSLFVTAFGSTTKELTAPFCEALLSRSGAIMALKGLEFVFARE